MEVEEPTGKCPLCTINLYGAEVTILPIPVKDEKGKSYTNIIGKPVVFPCGIYRDKQGRCPWEKPEEQEALTEMKDYEKIAGLLGTMHTNE